MSLRGYCRTLSERIACRPAIKMTRLTTIARTGRLTYKSVNFINTPPRALPVSYRIERSDLAVLRLGAGIVLRFYCVVHQYGGAIAQSEGAGTHHLVPGIETRNNAHLVTARTLNLHDLLPHPAIRIPFRIFHLYNDEDGIAVGRVVNRRSRQRHDLP